VPPATGQYTIHDLGTNRVNFDIQSTSYEFAPPCSLNAPQQASVRWYDADNSQDPNPGQDGSEPEWHDIPINFDLYEIAPGTANLVLVKHIDGTTNPIVGGSGAYEEYTFTARPGYKYKWVWRDINGPTQPTGSSNINAANNVEMWLPYDSINYDLTCFNYHSTVAPADGKVNNQQLDFSNPANRDVKFWINAQNQGGDLGPVATTDPVVTTSVHPGSWVTPDGTGPTNINRAIPGLTTLNDAGKFGYTLSLLTPTGTKLCFSDTIQPHTQVGDPPFPSDNQICYTVLNNSRYPLVAGYNGDVHAGGGLCGQGQSPGTVEGNGAEEPSDSSETQYVVSATNSPNGIINFGSNESASGSSSNTLDLGSTGGYEEVCREDLLAAANAYRAAGGAVTAVLGGNTAANPYHVDGWAGLYYITGTSYIEGQVNNKTTIVQTAGDLNIVGNITLTTTSFPPTQVPSLGIIAANNILIDSSVTHVGAYLFSDGLIDTCVQGEISTTACTNNLLVNGFLMGNTIDFHRIGPTNTLNARIAETVVLTPQIYLNPPQFFDASVDNILLQGQGEEQPLF
jgi:hypothetical protein